MGAARLDKQCSRPFDAVARAIEQPSDVGALTNRVEPGVAGHRVVAPEAAFYDALQLAGGAVAGAEPRERARQIVERLRVDQQRRRRFERSQARLALAF